MHPKTRISSSNSSARQRFQTQGATAIGDHPKAPSPPPSFEPGSEGPLAVRVGSSRPNSSSEFSATQCVRAGLEQDEQHGAVIPPLYLSTNFTFQGLGQPRDFDYTRSGNPTRSLLAEAISELEGGAGATVTGSGMSAIMLVSHLLPAEARVVVPSDSYGGTFRLFSALAESGRLEVQFANPWSIEDLEQACENGADLLWLETPSNPLLRITDLEAACRIGHRAGALVAVDNTFLSPALQNPLALGADLVVHSTTKYLNGHSDVVGGAVVAADPALAETVGWWANCLGIAGAPFDSYLTLRGLRTLGARMRVHQENTEILVEHLLTHEAVAQVFYPGLVSHPGHQTARRQQRGFGAMISFQLRGGLSAVQAFLAGLRHISLAESLGGVESLVAHPVTMTHASMTPEARERAGIDPGLVRLSVGIEAVEDLAADLDAALERALAAGES